MSKSPTAYEGWAIVELMGHRRLAGHVSEAVQYGAPMLRLDVPGQDGLIATQFYGGAALYCVTPTTEEIARAVASTSSPAPVQRWELTPPRPAPERANHDLETVDDDGDDDDDDDEENPLP